MPGPIRIAILASGRQARAEMERTGLAGTQMGKSVSRAAKAMGLAFAGFEIAHVAGEMIKSAGEFQKATTLLVTAGGEAQKNLALVSKGILSISSATGTSATDLADGMYLIEKAGIRGAAGLTVLKNAAEGAKAENVDMGTEAQAVTSIMTSYHKKAADSAAVVNQLVAASGAAKTSMQEFAGSLATVLPSASAAHLSFSEVGGAIATLTQHGTSAAESTQELAFAIRNLQAPNQVASREMQQLGINVTDLSKNLGKRGLTGSLQLVEEAILKHMGKSGLVMLDAFRKSKTAGEDLQIMLQHMPPDLQKVSKAFLTGSRTGKDYTADVKGMGGSAFAMGMQFKALVQQSKGFNDVLKTGGAAKQTYTDALKKIMGGAIGMNTALQLSGENMAGFKDRVDEVNKAARDKSGVSTWAQTAQTFDVQASRVKESFKNLGITLALPALPGLAKAFSGLATGASQAAPQIQGMFGVLKPLGEVVKVVAEGFGALPGPLKTVALEAGIAALVFPRLAAGAVSATAALGGQVTMARVLALMLKEDGLAATTAALGMGTMSRSVGALAGVGGMVALTVGAQKGNQAVAGLGGALAGAAIGAQIGTAALPGLGTAIGGVIGGVGGLALGMLSVHKHSDDATASTEALNRELARKQAIQVRRNYIDQLVTTLDRLSGATTKATRQTVFQNLLGTDKGTAAVKGLQKLGFTQGQIVDITTNSNSKAAKSYAGLQGKIQAYQRASQQYLAIVYHSGPARTQAQVQAIGKRFADLRKQFHGLSAADAGALEKAINAQIGDVDRSQEKWKQLQLGVRKYIGTLKGVPPRVATYFRTVGGKGTLDDAQKIARKFHVVNGTTARLILKAEGLEPSRRAIASLVSAATHAKPKLKTALGSAASDAGTGAGQKTATSYATGMSNKLHALQQEMNRPATHAVTATANAALAPAFAGGHNMGASMGDGGIAGLNSKFGPFYTTAFAFVTHGLAGMQAGLDSHSPSRKAAKLGVFMGQGGVLGLRSTRDSLYREGRSSAEAALRGMRDGSTGSAGLYARQQRLAAARQADIAARSQGPWPDRMTLEVDGHRFSAFVRHHSRSVARDEMDQQSAFDARFGG